MNITERFLKYVGYGTNSDEKSETCPSTPNQLVLGAAIAEELKALGLTDVEQDADVQQDAHDARFDPDHHEPRVGRNL